MKHRNPYADKLLEFKDFTFTDERLTQNKTKWLEFFLDKMNSTPLKTVLEIGCSNVEFLTAIASSHPQNAYIGIDWKFKVLYRGAVKIFKSGNFNQALMRGRAEELAEFFGDKELDEIWIFYPDPWAKKRQLKHRLICEDFLIQCAQVLKPSGKICIKTDHPGYYQWMLAVLGEPQPARLPSYDVIHAAGDDAFKMGMSGKQILLRKPMAMDELPAASHAVKKLFRVDCRSIDFWNDVKTDNDFNLKLEGSEYLGVPTLFEKGFLLQKLPIYFIRVLLQAAQSAHRLA